MKKHLIPMVIAAFTLPVVVAWNVPFSTTQVLPAFVNVTDRTIGVHMTQEEQRELDFGSLFPGAATTRTLNLSRGNSPPARVYIEVEGGIASWVTIERNDFILDEPAQINVTLDIPKGTGQGRYSGSANIRYTTSYGASLLHMLSRR